MLTDMQPSVQPPFDGALVRLRAREQADLTALNDMFNDPDVLAGLTMSFPQAHAGIRTWFEEGRTDDSQVVFVVETLADREPIGICALEGIDARSRSAMFGIWIGQAHWGKGYGTDATRTICRFGFRHMNLHRIGLTVYADTNSKALRAYEKAGFRVEGTLRQAQFLGGRYVDVLQMGLLADELIEP